MRITAEAKQQTRARILEVAARLFAEQGFEATTTRDLAAAADIAVGTLFNYFPSKEALGLDLIGEAAAAGHDTFQAAPSSPDEALAETLFRLVVCELRALEAARPFVAEVLEASGAAVRPGIATEARTGGSFPSAHLDVVAGLLRRRGGQAAISPATSHLYLTLYLGILAFWSRDESAGQAQTLALLDQSTRLVARMLEERDSNPEVDHATHAQ